MVHPTTYHNGGIPDIFSQPCGNIGLTLEGDRCWQACPSLFKIFTFERRRQYTSRPSNSHIAHFNITYKFTPTQKCSNIIIYSGGNIKIIFLFFFLFSFLALFSLISKNEFDRTFKNLLMRLLGLHISISTARQGRKLVSPKMRRPRGC